MSTGPAFSFATTADEVATAFADEIKGKNVLITGTSVNGIGFEAARVVAKHANLVIITGYNDERLKVSEAAIKKDVPKANIRRLTLDLASLAGVRKAAAEVNAYPESLHVLVHNAGAPAGPFKLTVDGLEHQIATDHVGPFLFTKLIKAKLLAAATKDYKPRVVFVSSSAHAFAPGVDYSSMGKPSAETYDPMGAYILAKAANVLFGIELSNRSKGAVLGYSLHPGTVFTNMSQKDEMQDGLKAMGVLGPDGQPNLQNPNFEWKSIEQGAATTVAAAFDPRITGQPGAYLEDSVVANDKVAAYASDAANAAQLWTTTEKVIGETFTF
ncbi:hypothetical protein C8R43DRAFT_242219 [Mycena crocata]|nr:hypothetical protein C8R43DRAFT_242219 [Mycena crocata]